MYFKSHLGVHYLDIAHFDYKARFTKTNKQKMVWVNTSHGTFYALRDVRRQLIIIIIIIEHTTTGASSQR